LLKRSGGLYNTGPYTHWLHHPEGAPPRGAIVFPGAPGVQTGAARQPIPTAASSTRWCRTTVRSAGWRSRRPVSWIRCFTNLTRTLHEPFRTRQRGGPRPIPAMRRASDRSRRTACYYGRPLALPEAAVGTTGRR
jgi:hypothetical protein